jgi:predicted DCC family thiol-disulfide oxidoreductase YuxK
MNENIIFYDSKCLLCSKSVNFINSIDKNNRFLFAPIHGETYIKTIHQKLWQEDTIVYYRKNKTFIRSQAIIQIFLDLGGIWKVFIIFKIIPASLLDFLYKLIASHRKRLNQNSNKCSLPNETLKKKLLS